MGPTVVCDAWPATPVTGGSVSAVLSGGGGGECPGGLVGTRRLIAVYAIIGAFSIDSEAGVLTALSRNVDMLL